MRKKKKKMPSLTAKQRKELRETELRKKGKGKLQTAETEGSITSGGEGAVQAKPFIGNLSKKKFFILLAVIFLALIIILIGVLTPLVIIPAIYYGKTNNPVAKITLSNGMVLEFVIYEEDCPIASTNFIYLAKNGFFNGTIIFDKQGNFIRFGAYTDPDDSSKMRSKDENYLAKLKDLVPNNVNSGVDKPKFGYRLNKDASLTADRGREKGVLSFMQGLGNTEFQMCAVEGSHLTIDGTSVVAVAFAASYTEKTIKNLEKLNSDTYQTKSFTGTKYYTLVNPIRISKIKLYNLNKKKWKKFHFTNDFLKYDKNLSYWSN